MPETNVIPRVGNCCFLRCSGAILDFGCAIFKFLKCTVRVIFKYQSLLLEISLDSSSKQVTKANDTMKEQKAAEQLMEDILFVKDSVFANLKPRIRKGGLQRSKVAKCCFVVLKLRKVWSCITGCSLYLHENPKVFQDVLLEFFDSPTLQSGLPSVSFNELFRYIVFKIA